MTDWQFRDERDAAALDRFWDHLTEGVEVTLPEVAPEDVAAIRAFQNLAHTQPPDPAFLSRLEDQLMLGQRPTSSSTSTVAYPFPANGHLPSLVLRLPGSAVSPPRGREAFQLFAMAAAALLVVGLALFTLRRDDLTSQPIHLSALLASATPEAATAEALLVVPLSDVMEPSIGGIAGDRMTSWNLFTVEVAPETSATWTAQHATCCPGPRFEYVLEGTYRVRADQAMKIVRASNPDAPEVVSAGTEVTLGPGDARIARNTDAFSAVNGDTPLQLLLGYMIIDKPYNEPLPPGWVIPSGTWQSTDYPASAWSMVPADLGTLQLRLERVKLDPDEAFPRDAGVIGQIGVATEPDSAIASQGDGTVRNLGPDPLTVYILALEPRNP